MITLKDHNSQNLIADLVVEIELVGYKANSLIGLAFPLPLIAAIQTLGRTHIGTTVAIVGATSEHHSLVVINHQEDVQACHRNSAWVACVTL